MGKRQIRSQEKHSEGRKIPYPSEFLEGQDESPGLFAWGKRRLGDDSDCFFPILLQGGGHIHLEGNAIKLSGRTFLAPHRGSSPKG